MSLAILIVIYVISILFAVIKYNYMQEELLSLRRQVQKTDKPSPELPALTIGSNVDGQLSFSYPDGRKAYAVLNAPVVFTRRESLGIALGILKAQGVDGIAAAKTIVERQEKSEEEVIPSAEQ